jgi:hypothetical protein
MGGGLNLYTSTDETVTPAANARSRNSHSRFRNFPQIWQFSSRPCGRQAGNQATGKHPVHTNIGRNNGRLDQRKEPASPIIPSTLIRVLNEADIWHFGVLTSRIRGAVGTRSEKTAPLAIG